jgi:signal recognition particle subunit SRP54
MVLQDLGEKLLASLGRLASAKQVDDEFFKDFMKEVVNALREADVATPSVLQFMKGVKDKVDLKNLPPGMSARKIIHREVLNQLIAMVDPGRDPYRPVKGRPNVYMMVGLQGAGKTTTCAKLGGYYKRLGWKAAVVAADTFRAGAREQLMQNAQQVGISYYVDFDTQDPVAVALAGVEKYKKERFDMIIVDTSGRHMQESALFEEMQQMEAAINPDEVIFVLDGTIGQMASVQAKAFAEAVSVGSIIVTKLDSSAKGGGALSAVAATNSPIAYYGTGEAMVMLEEFQAQGFVSRMLGFGDASSLARKIEQIDKDKQKEIADSILKGQFTFRELYSQYTTVLEMGDLSSLIDSMGMGKLVGKGQTPESMEDNVKKMLVVMDSMTDREMGQPDLLRDEGRKRRIAAGSGCNLAFVQYVVDEQKRWAQMFKKMDRGALSRLAMMEAPKGMNQRQLQQDLQCMARSMDPQMLQQLGGINGLSNIMQKTWQAEKQAGKPGPPAKGKK